MILPGLQDGVGIIGRKTTYSAGQPNWINGIMNIYFQIMGGFR